MIPAYFPMKKKISFAQEKMTPSIPECLSDSVFDLPVDPEPIQTMNGIEPIRIRPLDCSMLRMTVTRNRLKPIRINRYVIMIWVLLSVWFCDIQ